MTRSRLDRPIHICTIIMTDKTTAEVQDLIGYPEYTLIDNGTKLSPLESWNPPPGRMKFSEEDLYQLFHKGCIAFVGDSLQRRAGDTLHALIEHRTNTSQIDEYIYNWTNLGHEHLTRVIGSGDPWSNDTQYYKEHCEPGTSDSLWYPSHLSFKEFKYEKNHTILIAGNGPWDNQIGDFSPNEWKKMMNETIHHLYNSVPNSVLIFWKTNPWGAYFKWNFSKPNRKTSGKSGSNYLVYYANQAAKEIIDSINASNLILLDWSKEIFPYSFSERLPTNMMAENNDQNAWHVGPKGRGLLLQMLASEIHQHGGVKPFGMKKSEYEDESTKYVEFQNKTLRAIIGFCLVVIVMLKRKTNTSNS
jgi:hypothetical protein